MFQLIHFPYMFIGKYLKIIGKHKKIQGGTPTQPPLLFSYVSHDVHTFSFEKVTNQTNQCFDQGFGEGNNHKYSVQHYPADG